MFSREAVLKILEKFMGTYTLWIHFIVKLSAEDLQL